MTREIDYDDLSIEDRKYLQDRGQLPEGESRVAVKDDGSLVNDDGDDTEVFDAGVIDDEDDDLNDMNVAALRQRLDEMQLSTEGNKKDLIQRIRESS